MKRVFSHTASLIVLLGYCSLLITTNSVGQEEDSSSLESSSQTPASRKDSQTQNKKGATEKLIQWLEKPWVDVGLVSGSDTGSASGTGLINSGTGSSLGSGGGSGKRTSIEFDDNVAKGEKPGENGNNENEGSENAKGKSKGNTGISSGESIGRGKGGTVAFGLWYPMCLFIHPGSGGGNDTVKGLVDHAAACGVNLVVFPVTVKSVPDNHSAINAAQSDSCNAAEALGVPRASTSTCVPYMLTAARMCDAWIPLPGGGRTPDPGVAGCAQLSGPGADSSKIDRYQQLGAGGHGFGGVHSGAGAVPSIERIGACTAGVVGHEALGHSMWGHPNGKRDGNGIGLPDNWNTSYFQWEPQKEILYSRQETEAEIEFPHEWVCVGRRELKDGQISIVNGIAVAAAGGGWWSGSGVWTSEGCSNMRQSAYPNDGKWKWDPDRKVYYVEQKDPELQWDLMSHKKLFSPPKKPPKGGINKISNGGNPGGGNRLFGDPRPAVDEDKPKSVVNPPPPSNGIIRTNTEIKHKKVQSKGTKLSLFEGINTSTKLPDAEDPSEKIEAYSGDISLPEPGLAKSTGRITFDDTSKKGSSSSSVSGSEKTGTTTWTPSQRPGKLTQEDRDRSNSANSYDSTFGFSSPYSGGQSGSSDYLGGVVSSRPSERIGFDDSQPKGASSGSTPRPNSDNRAYIPGDGRLESNSGEGWTSGNSGEGFSTIMEGTYGSGLDDEFFKRNKRNTKDRIKESGAGIRPIADDISQSIRPRSSSSGEGARQKR